MICCKTSFHAFISIEKVWLKWDVKARFFFWMIVLLLLFFSCEYLPIWPLGIKTLLIKKVYNGGGKGKLILPHYLVRSKYGLGIRYK